MSVLFLKHFNTKSVSFAWTGKEMKQRKGTWIIRIPFLSFCFVSRASTFWCLCLQAYENCIKMPKGT